LVWGRDSEGKKKGKKRKQITFSSAWVIPSNARIHVQRCNCQQTSTGGDQVPARCASKITVLAALERKKKIKQKEID